MSTTLTTIRWLSIFTGALSLFYLGHAWFEFGLGEVFHRIHEWYVGLVHPVVELLRPVALWLVRWLGWSLPVWWKDAFVLYAAIGGAMGRGSAFGSWFLRDRVLDLERTDPKTGETRRASITWDPGADRSALMMLPVRVVAWPLYLIYGLLFELVLRSRWAGNWRSVLRHGYIGTAAVEFAKILAGALIFAGLNAGLG